MFVEIIAKIGKLKFLQKNYGSPTSQNVSKIVYEDYV